MHRCHYPMRDLGQARGVNQPVPACRRHDRLALPCFTPYLIPSLLQLSFSLVSLFPLSHLLSPCSSWSRHYNTPAGSGYLVDGGLLGYVQEARRGVYG